MGSHLSQTSTEHPAIYVHHSFIEKEDGAWLSSEKHKVNLMLCETIFQQIDRRRIEHVRFDEFRHNWNQMVAELKEKYPQWTSVDLLNFRHQFKVFDCNNIYLLNFNDANKALDYNHVESPPEHRRTMFDLVDTHHYNSINFEEYLELLSNFNIHTPAPKAPKTDDIRDPHILDLLSDIEKSNPFTDIVYGLF